MKASHLGWIVSALVLVAAVGCGNNGDPAGKNYKDLKAEANVKADPGTPNAVPVPAPVVTAAPVPAVDCNHPMEVSVKGNEPGNNLLTFTDGTESTFTINVRSNMGPNFKLEPTQLTPDLSADFHSKRAKFTNVSNEGANATYTFTWKPARASGGPNFYTMFLKFTPSNTSICDIKGASAVLALIIQIPDQKTGDAK